MIRPMQGAQVERRARGLAVWIALAAAALGGVAWSLAGMEIDRTIGPRAGVANVQALWPFWIASGLAWAALTAMALALWRAEQGRSPRDPRRSRGLSVLLIVTVAVAARVVVLLTHQPALSDDVYRYVFDGRNLAHGVNPYLVTPAAVATDDEQPWPAARELAARVNNPQLTTIYLPASQWCFAAIAQLIPATVTDPDACARVFRAAFVVVELLAMLMMALALHRIGRSAWWPALYAWHPLPLAEIAGSGHQDVVGIALLLGAMLLVASAVSRLAGATVGIALAGLVKPVALPVALLVLRGRSWSAWLVCGVLGGAVCLAVASPLLLTHEQQPLRNLASTAHQFTGKWAHFGSLYEPLLGTMRLVDPIDDKHVQWQKKERHERIVRYVCLGMVMIVVILVWFSRLDLWAGTRAIFFAMVLFSTTAHPWYLLWALALTPIAFSPAVWVASLTLPWGYAALGDTARWSTPTWLLVAAYAPVYVTLAIDVLRTRRRSRIDAP